jgi:two-component system response regulator DegU
MLSAHPNCGFVCRDIPCALDLEIQYCSGIEARGRIMITTAIQTLLVTRSPFYTEALSRILERDHSIRINTPPEFMVPLTPNSVAGESWVVIFDLNSNHLSFDVYMDQLLRRRYKPRILLYGDTVTDEALVYYLSRGAHGCIVSSKMRGLLFTALKHVASGGIWFPHKTISHFVDRVVTEMTHVSRLFRVEPLLSRRENQVWTLVSRGATNKDIAIELSISERTVKFHISNLLEKLDVDNRRQLMMRYGKLTFFEPAIEVLRSR